MMDGLILFQEGVKTVIAFAGVLSVLVFIHELGHYLVARFHGVMVEVFSIGFGPELFGWTSPCGTRWKISLIPLGGYVKMFGDANEASSPDGGFYDLLSEEDQQKTLQSKSPLKKMSVAFAGPFANLLLAFLFLTIVYTFYGRTNSAPVIGNVESQSPAFEIGLKAGDKIVAINQQPVETFSAMQRYIQNSPEIPVNLSVERDGVAQEMQVTPASVKLGETTIGVMGVRPQIILTSFVESISYAISSVYQTSMGIFKLLGNLFTSDSQAKQLGSILSIAKMSRDSLEGGIFALLAFMAMLSINLGVINLLPIPVLDGGHILIHAIELIIRRPLSVKVQDTLFKVGFGLLIGAMLYTFWNDLERFKIIRFITETYQKFF
ncbi:MAG: RIP metalloprotease RseP [Alphaproteobacteria bacterium]